MSEAKMTPREGADRRRRQELSKRELLVLIYHHLLEEGHGEAAEVLRQNKMANGFWDVGLFDVCDNVDLNLILADYIAFYQMRFHKSPGKIFFLKE